MFRRGKTRARSKSRLEIEEGGGLPPGLEEAITRQGQPGKTIPGFTWPEFPVPAPFEVPEPPADVLSEGQATDIGPQRPHRQVVVVGADPAGLTLAIALAQQNIAVTVLDARKSLSSSSRSATWSAHTLELWARCGLAAAALAASVPRRRQEVAVVDGDPGAGVAAGVAAPSVQVATAEVEGREGRTVAPLAVHLPQYRVEQLLHDALVNLPEAQDGLVDVRWQSTVEDVAVTAEGVVLRVAVPEPKGKTSSKEVSASYVVLCAPGTKAAVRELASTPARCASPAATRTVLSVDLQVPAPTAAQAADGGGGVAERRLLLTLEGGDGRDAGQQGIGWLAVSQHSHPHGLIRLDALLPAGVDLAKAAREDGARELARSALGPAAGGAATVLSCIAQQFRIGPMSAASKHGRLFLCGEALAVLSPFGGAAGNVGVEDAANLAWKLALVALQGAPPALLETYQLEREAAHGEAMRRQLHAEQVLAPSTPAHREVQRAALSLLRGGHELGAALLSVGSAMAPPTRLDESPLILRDAAAVAGIGGAPFRHGAPGPGDVFADCTVEDLELEVAAEAETEDARPTTAALGRGYLLGHVGPFFTLVLFAMSMPDIPWEVLKQLERSKLQMTLEIVRKVVIVLDASGLERMSDEHVEAVGRAQRIGARLLADRGGSAAGAFDARPGTAVLLRPDLRVAARWRTLETREAHTAFLRATGHLLHEAAPPWGQGVAADRGEPRGGLPPLAPRAIAPAPLAPSPAAPGGAGGELLASLAARLAAAPAERRLALAAAAVLLLADRVGQADVVQQAIAAAAAAAGITGAAEGASALRLSGRLARLLEVGSAEEDVPQQLVSVAGEFAVAPDRDRADLVPPDSAVEAIARVLRDQPEVALSAPPPAQGTADLRTKLAARLSEAEGVQVSPEAVVVSEGAVAILRHVLAAALAPAAAAAPLGPAPAAAPEGGPDAEASSPGSPARQPSAGDLDEGASRPPSAFRPAPRQLPGEVLVVGPCPEAWRPVLASWKVRSFLPPPGPNRDFAVQAVDVARHVSAATQLVLLPLFSHATGLPVDAAQLQALGHFVDYEAQRRRNERAGDEMPAGQSGLMLAVDVTLRNLQLDVHSKSKAPAPLHVLAVCRNGLVFADLFHEWCAAPGLRAQYAAVGPSLAPWATSALSAAAVEGARCGSGGALVQALAALLPHEQLVLESLRRRREVLCEALARAGLAVAGGRPRAGRFLLARLPEDVDAGALCAQLAAAHQVVADPGEPLGCPGCIRLSFAEKFDFLEDTAPAFSTALRELRRVGRPRLAPVPAVGGAPGAAAGATAAGASSPTAPADWEAAWNAAEAAAAAEKEGGEHAERHEQGGAVDESGAAAAAASPAGGVDAEAAAEEDGHADEEAEAQAGEPEPDDPDREVDEQAIAEAERSGKAAHLAAQLRRGAKAIACVAQLSGSITTELIAQAGFEVIVVDHENGPGNFGVAADLVRSTLGAGAHPVFRLPSADVTQIRRAVEAGAEGLILPRVASAAEVEEFVELVRIARLRAAREEDAVEWRQEAAEAEEGAAESEEGAPGAKAEAGEEGAGRPRSNSKRSVERSEAALLAQAPRPLVAVELDPAGGLTAAEEILGVEGLDMLLVDPERVIEAFVTKHGGPTSGYLPAPRVDNSFEAEADAGGGVPRHIDEEGARADEDAAGSSGDGESPAAFASPKPTAPSNPPPLVRRGFNLALKAPPLLQAKREAAGIAGPTPAVAAQALREFWQEFDGLPARASEKRKLLGCASHARTAPFELLTAGHSLVALAADLVLLREGAVRHATEVKSSKQASGPRQYVAPLESARARLATGALVNQLRRSKKALGAFLHLGDPLAAELVSLAGFEVVVLDHEQGPGDLLNAVSLIHAASSAGSHALLRVPGREPAYLRRALQLGVEGLILPSTESKAQAEDFVALAKQCWPVSSLRGAAGPGAAALRPNLAPSAQHLRRRGEELLLKACQVETEAGLAAVKEIASVEGVDMVFFAPVELAASCARGQEAGLMLALETAEAEVKKARKLLGGMLVPGRSLEQMFIVGYDLVCTTSDVILIRSAAENLVLEAKPPASGPKAELVRWVASGRQARLANDTETLVAKLRKSKQARALGALARLDSAPAVELVAKSGFEVVVLDHARGPGDLLGAMGLIHAASTAGAHAILRVPALSHAHLRRALQIGVEGIILPHVESAAEAHELVKLCLYPSQSYRDDSHAAEARLRNQPFRRMDFSFAPPLVEFYGQRVAEFTRRQGEALLVAAQIDSPLGAEHARAIAKVQGIDMIFVDALRLSGLDVERVEEAARSGGKMLGGLLVPGCKAEDMFRAGYKLVCAASDQHLLSMAARACARSLRPGQSGDGNHR